MLLHRGDFEGLVDSYDILTAYTGNVKTFKYILNKCDPPWQDAAESDYIEVIGSLTTLAWPNTLDLVRAAFGSKKLEEVVHFRSSIGISLLHISLMQLSRRPADVNIYIPTKETKNSKTPKKWDRRQDDDWRKFIRNAIIAGAEISSTNDDGLSPLQLLLEIQNTDIKDRLEGCTCFH